jgi:hypothetical protein
MLLSAAASDKLQRHLSFAPVQGHPDNAAINDNLLLDPDNAAKNDKNHLLLDDNNAEQALLLQHDQNADISGTIVTFHSDSEAPVAEKLKQIAMEMYTTSSIHYDLDFDDESESSDSCSEQDEESFKTEIDASVFLVKDQKMVGYHTCHEMELHFLSI